MYYVSSESSIALSGNLDTLNIVIRNTADKDFIIECPWQCLHCRFKQKGVDERLVAGVDAYEYSYIRVLRALSSVEANLIRCLGFPSKLNEVTWWFGRRCSWIGNFHFLNQYRVGMSLPRMLFEGLDENLKTTKFPVKVSEKAVEVAISDDYGFPCSVVYPVLDYQGLCSAITKYKILHPGIADIQRYDIEYGARRVCPKGVESCDLRFGGDTEGHKK